MNDTIQGIGNEMTHFSTGAKRDIQEDKGRCDLMPLSVVGIIYEHWNQNKQKLIDKITSNNYIGLQFSNIEEYIHTGHINNLCNVVCYALLSNENWHNNQDGCDSDNCTYTELGQMFMDVSKHFKRGAEKYGEWNWNKGIPLHSFIDSAIRHLIKWVGNWNDERHDLAFIWNIICCIHTQLFICNAELMDLPFCKNKEEVKNECKEQN